jgi:transposase
LVDHVSNKNRAAKELGCTRRTIDRYVANYKKVGKQAFSHGNKGKKPSTTIPEKDRWEILKLYNEKYYDCSYELFAELLAKAEGIHISVGTVRNILMAEYILSPRANRVTIRRMKKELEERSKTPLSKKALAETKLKLIDIEDAHPRRPRCANFGEELQMDASVYNWFGNLDTHLHGAIDDASGRIVGLHFDYQETLDGYYHVFEQILKGPGIPYKFRTDKRTVFEYKSTRSTKVEEDTSTQFAYACKELGVHIETTSIPQGKARIERLWETLKGRLPILLRLAGINTIEAANEFLGSYIEEFNKQFALDSNAIPSVFEKQPSEEKINLTLAVITGRTVDAGHSVKFDKKHFRLLDEKGNPQYPRGKTKGLVIKAFNGEMYFSVNETLFALEEIPFRAESSTEFDNGTWIRASKKPYIPPMSHPWKKESFDKFCRRQRHRPDLPPAC